MHQTKTLAQENIDQMLDMVVDIYNNQFTKDDLLDRLHAPDAVEELQQQIQFIAQGQMDEERKATSENHLNSISYKEHKENMKKLMLQMIKEGGKDINDILDMPFAFSWS